MAEEPHILVGVDGSEDGLRALHYGMQEALARRAALRVVYAVDEAALAGGWGVVYEPALLEEVGEAVIAAGVDQATSRGFPADRIQAEVVLGNPAAVLTRLSERAVLTIVGRRAMSGLERIFVGSTSVALASGAKSPLIMISAATNPDETGGRQRIGVGVDTTAKAEAALRWGLTEAVRRESRVLVQHVVPTPPPGLSVVRRPTAADKERMVAAGRAAVEHLLTPLRKEFPDVPCDVDVSLGQPVDVLVNRSEGLDLLVLGAHGKGLPGSGVSGVVRGVMAHAQCPVGIIRTWSGDRYGIS